jgi:hypothetical protein
MATNPYPKLPADNMGTPMQEYPSPKVALARKGAENSAASSVISVTHDTTTIEIAAVNQAAIMRWVPTTDSTASVVGVEGTANFDHVISKDTVRRFAIPIESFVGNNPSSQMGANRRNGLYQRVAVKSVGVGSVLTSEF